MANDFEIHQMDVKSEFLNGGLDEELYMQQPKGFVQPGQEHLIWNFLDATAVCLFLVAGYPVSTTILVRRCTEAVTHKK